MGKRKSASKSLRFDVFNRDGFTCQYCGRTPPDTVLELDHLVAVANGGDNEELNLVTACADCNRGKAAKVLGAIKPSPDADLKRLKIEQETAEYKRYLEAAVRRDEQVALLVERIQCCWQDNFTMDTVPSEPVCKTWINRYAMESIEAGIIASVPTVHRGQIGTWNFSAMIRYVSAVIRNIEQGENDG